MITTRPRVRSVEAAVQRGRRVYLRFAARGDRSDWCALREANLEHNRPWEPTLAGDPTSDERFDRLLRTQRTSDARRYLLCRRSDEAILGMINFGQIVRGAFQNAYLGYWIGVDHVRRGYMTEGVRLSLRHAFVDLGLHRVEANIKPDNQASLALARRIGFREEGFSPRYLQIAGQWADHVRFAMTIEDWQSPRRRGPRQTRIGRDSPRVR